ncbi:MAG: hypothetical protein MK207_03395 [Saprospiraceae bacterium]|nr:hypothetical protein [Saprospiraceae bacterium]
MFWAAIVIIVIGSFYFDLQKSKLKQDKKIGTTSKDIKLQISELMAENEDLKERLRNIEYILSDEEKQINLDYEKEQIRLDNKNKYGRD